MILKTLATATSLALAASALDAATLQIDTNSQLTGALNVDVAGTLFDVTFIETTCIALFDGCDALTDFPFATRTLPFATLPFATYASWSPIPIPLPANIVLLLTALTALTALPHRKTHTN